MKGLVIGLLESGEAVPLELQLPPWKPSAWPSMYTGINGVCNFFRFEGDDWDVVNRTYVQAVTVWELLSMRGFSSAVFDVPE